MIKVIFNSFCYLFFFLFLTGCSGKKTINGSVAKQEMINTDIAFSDYSNKHGMKKAFIEYIDDDGVLLRPDHLPIVGADAIDFLTQQNDSSYTLTWEPSFAAISSSADLGYTYGIYKLEMKDTVSRGTYVSIWKKQPDGKWKFVLDTGNEGIGQ